MSKRIGLQQLAKKKYVLVEGLPAELQNSIGELEDSFDALIYGRSNNGKSSFIAILLIALIKSLQCKCEYVAYEEAHGKTIQDTMIKRYNMFDQVGNALQVADHYTYDELEKRMARRQSAKIWVIDSIQASGITEKQYFELKRKYVNGKKRKIIIVVSWSKGKDPLGATAGAIHYLAHIKMWVHQLIMFPMSRYGGGDPYIIHAETAVKRLGEKVFRKLTGIAASKALKASKQKDEEKAEPLEMESQISE